MTPGPLLIERPLDIDDAREAARLLAKTRREAEKRLRRLTIKAAETEGIYRQALAEAFLTAEGSSAAEREASARAKVAEKSFDRDLAKGLVKAQLERLAGLEGERSQLKSLLDFSRSMYERESVPGPAPQFSDGFRARAA